MRTLTWKYLSASVVLVCIAFCATLSAQSLDKTTEALGFSRLARDPVSAGMGFSGKAAESGAWSATSSTGTLPLSDMKLSAALSYQGWAPKGVKTTNFAGGLAFKTGRFGLAVAAAHQGGAPYTIKDQMGIGKTTFTPSDLYVAGGAGFAFNPSFALGVNVRYFSSSIAEGFSYAGLGFDVLAVCRLSGLTLTGGVSNIGTVLGREEYNIPASATVAGEYKGHFASEHGLRIGLDVDMFLSSGSVSVAAGAEYSFKDIVFLRAGYHFGSELCVLPSFATLGAGLWLYGVRLDFAYLLGNDHLGGTMTIGLGYTF